MAFDMELERLLFPSEHGMSNQYVRIVCGNFAWCRKSR